MVLAGLEPIDELKRALLIGLYHAAGDCNGILRGTVVQPAVSG